jgi:glutathione peroxidase
MSSVYDFSSKDIDGIERPLDAYRGKALLIVNVASQCGLTPQYEGLEMLYRKYKDRGFVVLGYPCNQFGAQEPGNEAQIKEFCSTRYDVSFPLFAKIEVNGNSAHPLYQYLKQETAAELRPEPISWNFAKFLVDKNGGVVKRYAPSEAPEAVERELLKIL